MSRLKFVEPVMVACALFGSLIPACHAQAGPQERAWNIERVGVATLADGKPDLIAYSKLAPWPNTDGRYLYSGCYDPSPLAPGDPAANRCFMTVDLVNPEKPRRLATVYAYDPVRSPAPPMNHIVFSPDYRFPNLPVKIPCMVNWSDPDIAAGKKAPGCWDPGWNTHTHYVAEAPGKILAVNQERLRGGTDRQAGYHGVKFYDISDPATPKFLSYWEAPTTPPDRATGLWADARGSHHFNFKGRFLYLGTEYKGFVGRILVILDATDPRHPKEAGKWWVKGQKTPEEDAARDWTQPETPYYPVFKNPDGKWTKYVALHYVSIEGNVAYLAYHQAGLILLDIADPAHPKLLSRTDYMVPGSDPTNPDIEACRKAAGGKDAACGNTHSGKMVPGTNLLMVSDEYFTCPYGHARIYDVADPKNPKLLSHFTTDQNTNCSADKPQQSADPSRFPKRSASSHLGNALGSGLYFMAWYGMGLRVMDISDPRHPVETGYYEYRIDRDLPAEDRAYAGADTYDVVLGPKGYLYVTDGTAGMRVLKYTGSVSPAK
jgi:hypothetical protein